MSGQSTMGSVLTERRKFQRGTPILPWEKPRPCPANVAFKERGGAKKYFSGFGKEGLGESKLPGRDIQIAAGEVRMVAEESGLRRGAGGNEGQ